MKTDKNRIISLVVGSFVLFLLFRYWGNVVSILLTILSASSPLLLGCVIAYVVNILMVQYEVWYEKAKLKSSLKRPLCMVGAYVSIILIVVLLFSIVVPEFIGAIQILVTKVPAQIEQIASNLNENSEIQGFIKELYDEYLGNSSQMQNSLNKMIEYFQSGVTGMFGNLVTTLTSIFSMMVSVLVGLIFSIYILSSKEKLARQIKLLMKTYLPKAYASIIYVCTVLNDSFHSFVVGQVLEAVIIGALCAIGMLILQFPYAVMIGALIGFTALIPVAGAYIGAIVGALMILTVSPLKAVFFIVYIVILQQVEGNLIYPRVVGKSIGLPGIWVLAAVSIGGGVMGFVGMLIGVPLAASLYKIIKNDILNRQKRQSA